MRDFFWSLYRSSPQVQGLAFRYEKAGLTVRNEPIPWSADAVHVEALVRFPGHVVKRKSDFLLQIKGPVAPPAVSPTTFHRHETSDGFRIEFRLPALGQTAQVGLYWRAQLLSQAVLPILSPVEFLENLRLESSTIYARLGPYTVPCRTIVGNQCQGLLAGGLLTSPTSLLPLLDLELNLELVDPRTGAVQPTPVRLASSQLLCNQALLCLMVPRRPRRTGSWLVRWRIQERELACSELRLVSPRAFRASLFVSDSRYVVQAKDGASLVTGHLAGLQDRNRVGPCFLVASREPGMAGLCPLQVRVHLEGSTRTPVALEQDLLVTDGPSPCLPGTLAAEELAQVTAFELLTGEHSLGILSLSPAPTAGFTSEGGFKPPDTYAWNRIAEEELNDRLNKLTDIPLE